MPDLISLVFSLLFLLTLFTIFLYRQPYDK